MLQTFDSFLPIFCYVNKFLTHNYLQLEARLRNLEGKELSRAAGSAKGKPKLEVYDKDRKKGPGAMITAAKVCLFTSFLSFFKFLFGPPREDYVCLICFLQTYNPAADSVLGLTENAADGNEVEKASEEIVVSEEKKEKKKKKSKKADDKDANGNAKAENEDSVKKDKKKKKQEAEADEENIDAGEKKKKRKHSEDNEEESETPSKKEKKKKRKNKD